MRKSETVRKHPQHQVTDRSKGRRLALLCVKILVALAVVEVTLRLGFLAYANLRQPIACGDGPPILMRMFYAYRGGKGMAVLPGDGAQKMVGDPHRGYKLSANLRTDYPSGAALTTNSRGARGTQEHMVPKPHGIRRLVALGDSITLGNGVADDQSWPAQLESILLDTEVVNLGCEAYAHDQMYAALQDDGLSLQPDIVILGFHEPDLQRNTSEYFCHEKPRWKQSAKGWRVMNSPALLPDQIQARYLALPMLYLFPNLLVDIVAAKYTRAGSGEAEAEEILDRTRRLAENAGARFILVRLPLFAWTMNSEFFARWCAKAGAECVDTFPAFEQAMGGDMEAAVREGFVLSDRWHYGAAGNRLVATVLRDYLATKPTQTTH